MATGATMVVSTKPSPSTGTRARLRGRIGAWRVTRGPHHPLPGRRPSYRGKTLQRRLLGDPLGELRTIEAVAGVEQRRARFFRLRHPTRCAVGAIRVED